MKVNRTQTSQFERLVASGAIIERFEPMLAPMEDIFLQVVREGQGRPVPQPSTV